MNTTPQIQPSVREWEEHFLRRWGWIFPVAGLLLATLTGGGFWAWVNGQWPIQPDFAQVLSIRALALAVLGGMIPLVWRLTLKRKLHTGVAIALAVLVVCGTETGLRQPIAQAAFWLASRARLEPNEHFMREACYIRLEEAARREAPAGAVVLTGSSQILNGVDEHLLAKLIAPRPVIRRSMFGMFPLKTLAMRPWIPFKKGDVCFMYLSELDFTNQEDFPVAWFRVYGSWNSLSDVMRCIGARTAWRRWRDVTDYALAATAELWRTRDFARAQLFHFFGIPRAAETGMDTSYAHRDEQVKKARATLTYSQETERAFRLFSERLAEAGVGLLVFEGDVNPEIYSPSRLAFKASVRAWMEELSREGENGFRYVSLKAQALDIQPHEWWDMTHLTGTGREKLTRRIAAEFPAAP